MNFDNSETGKLLKKLKINIKMIDIVIIFLPQSHKEHEEKIKKFVRKKRFQIIIPFYPEYKKIKGRAKL